MVPRSLPCRLLATIDLPKPPPASASQFGAISEPESATTANSSSINKAKHHSAFVRNSEPIRQFVYGDKYYSDRTVNPSDAQLKREVRLRLEWLDEEIALLKRRESWRKSQFTNERRRRKEKERLDDDERELHRKWDYIFFVTRYEEMVDKDRKRSTVEDHERTDDVVVDDLKPPER